MATWSFNSQGIVHWVSSINWPLTEHVGGGDDPIRHSGILLYTDRLTPVTIKRGFPRLEW